MRVGWLGQAIWAALKGDRRRQVETMGKDMAWFLNGDSPLPLKAWRRMQGWHRAAVEHTPPPDQITLNHITADRVELYCAIPPLPPPGDNTPLSVKPSHIDDSVPMEEEVEWAVRRLRGHRLGFPYRMRAEHL